MTRIGHYLICITTPKSPDDYFSQLITTRDDDGGLYYNVITMGEPCDDCKEGPEPWTCTHNLHTDAAWKSHTRAARWRKAYGQNMDIYMQEVNAMAGTRMDAVFSKELLAPLFDEGKDVDIRKPANIIYLAVDPAGGGKSDLAVTGVAQIGSRFVVVLLASERLTGELADQTFQLLKGSVDALRAVSLFRETPIVVIPEAQSTDACYWQSYLANCDGVCFMREGGRGKDRWGVPKTAALTNTMRIVLSWALSAQMFRFWRNMIAVSSSHAEHRPTSSLLRHQLKQQLTSYRADSDSNKSGGKNDMAITFMMIPHWSTVFWTNRRPEYDACKRRAHAVMGAPTLNNPGGPW